MQTVTRTDTLKTTFTTPKKCFSNVFLYTVSRIFHFYFKSCPMKPEYVTAKHLKYFFYFNTRARKSTPEETDNDDFRNTTTQKHTHNAKK